MPAKPGRCIDCGAEAVGYTLRCGGCYRVNQRDAHLRHNTRGTCAGCGGPCATTAARCRPCSLGVPRRRPTVRIAARDGAAGEGG